MFEFIKKKLGLVKSNSKAKKSSGAKGARTKAGKSSGKKTGPKRVKKQIGATPKKTKKKALKAKVKIKKRPSVRLKSPAKKRGLDTAKIKAGLVHNEKKRARKTQPAESYLGEIVHYFPHVKAGVIAVKKGILVVGDTIHIKGHTTDLKQKVNSLQIDRAPIEKAPRNSEAGIRLKSRARIGDTVYKLT